MFLLPRSVRHSLRARCVSTVLVAEKAVPLTVGTMVRNDSAVTPAARHFIALLHRAPHQKAKGMRPLADLNAPH